MLQRKRNQISETAFGHRVLTGKKAIVRIETDLMASFHRSGKNCSAKFPREVGRWNVPFSTSSKKGLYIVLPIGLVEVGCQKPACFVGQKRINAGG
jgi:hypothetical protein